MASKDGEYPHIITLTTSLFCGGLLATLLGLEGRSLQEANGATGATHHPRRTAKWEQASDGS